MKKWGYVLPALLLLALASPAVAEKNFGIGGGVRYNLALGDIDDVDFDEDYFSYMLSLKWQVGGILGLEAIADYYPGNGNIDYLFRPMGTVVLGDFINAGVGINSTYAKIDGGDSDWSDISYHFKVGLQIPLGDLLWLNADAYYFVEEIEEIEDFDEDYIIFAARLHFRL